MNPITIYNILLILVLLLVLFMPNHKDYVFWVLLLIIMLLYTEFVINREENIVTEGTNKNMVSTDMFSFPVYVINLKRKPERYQYTVNQLENAGISNYKRWDGTDGFKESPENLMSYGMTKKMAGRQGIAGCAASHINLWTHIADNKLGWTMIVEDDINIHPNFIKLFPTYWGKVPTNAKIVFVGHCGYEKYNDTKLVMEKPVMCLHAYMINHIGAQYLLDHLLPMNEPVDIEIVEHFKKHKGSYIFNGNVFIDGVQPSEYKSRNGDKCEFNGIIYQNRKEQGSVIHNEKTIY